MNTFTGRVALFGALVLLGVPGSAAAAEEGRLSLGTVGGQGVWLNVRHLGGTNPAGVPGLFADHPGVFGAAGSGRVLLHPERLQGGHLEFTLEGPRDGAVVNVGGSTVLFAGEGDTYTIPVDSFPPQGYDLAVHLANQGAQTVPVRQMGQGDPRYFAADYQRLQQEAAAAQRGRQARENGGLVPCDLCTIEDLVKLGVRIFNWLLAIGGAVALLAVIIAGIRFITAVFQGDSGAIEEAKGALRNAIIGLVVLLLAVVIVRTVVSIFDLTTNLPQEGEVGDILPE